MTLLKPIGLFCTAVCFAGTAQAATSIIDFPTADFSENDVISGFEIAPGIEATVSAEGVTSPSLGEARLYDTNPPVGADPDLEAPFTNVGLEGPAFLDPGLVLIIQQSDSPSDVANDDGRGGVITFTFNQMVTFMGFDLFDDVSGFVAFGDVPDLFTVTGASIIVGASLYVLARERVQRRLGQRE